MQLQVIDLPGDSLEYEQITNGMKAALEAGAVGMCCEIGLRRGGGSKPIIDVLATEQAKKLPYRVLVCVDPYGNIEYLTAENQATRHDYTNLMRDECMVNMYNYVKHMSLSNQTFINLQFYNLEDHEFFKRFHDGVIIYDDAKEILTDYMFVHFDGPHALDPLEMEMAFFSDRTVKGGVWVFDDIGNYPHDELEKSIFNYGFDLIAKGGRKASYQKK